MGLLCRIGIHRPMTYLWPLFTDVVAGRTVHEWECSCGVRWMAFRGLDVFRCKSSYQPAATRAKPSPEPREGV